MELPAPIPIRDYEGIDRARFDAEIRPARQPAVFRGLARDWPAVQAGRTSSEAAIAYLKRFSHEQPVQAIVGPPEIEGRFFYTPDLKSVNFQRGLSPLDPFLDRLLRDQNRDRPFAMAIQSSEIPEALPGFAEENRTDLVDADVVPRIWLGNAIHVATHYDLKENVGVVMAGRRRFTLFPPDQVANLYPGPLEPTPGGQVVSMVDLRAPNFDRFPKFREALESAQIAELEPGDLLIYPAMWWHNVEALEPFNVMVNYWWNAVPRFVDTPMITLKHALLSLRDRPEHEKAAWRELFDYYVFGDPKQAAAHLPEHVRGPLGPMDDVSSRRLRADILARLNR